MDAYTLSAIAQIICGDDGPIYRTGGELGPFFQRAGIPGYQHDGSTRAWWVEQILFKLNEREIDSVILRLAHPREYQGDRENLNSALQRLNHVLHVEGKRVGVRGTEPYIEGIVADFSESAGSPNPGQVKAIQFPPQMTDENLVAALGFWNAEYQKCAGAGACLASVVLLGAMLEAALLVLKKHPEESNKCPAAPKRDGRVKAFGEWTLSEMIDVACALGWIGKYAQSAGHGLRDYRNFIHANKLMQENENPDQGLVAICSRTVQKAMDDLAAKGLLA